jgi:hypothetical protein
VSGPFSQSQQVEGSQYTRQATFPALFGYNKHWKSLHLLQGFFYRIILGCGLESLHAAVDRTEQAACKAALLAAVAMPQEVAHAG